MQRLAPTLGALISGVLGFCSSALADSAGWGRTYFVHVIEKHGLSAGSLTFEEESAPLDLTDVCGVLFENPKSVLYEVDASEGFTKFEQRCFEFEYVDLMVVLPNCSDPSERTDAFDLFDARFTRPPPRTWGVSVHEPQGLVLFDEDWNEIEVPTKTPPSSVSTSLAQVRLPIPGIVDLLKRLKAYPELGDGEGVAAVQAIQELAVDASRLTDALQEAADIRSDLAINRQISLIDQLDGAVMRASLRASEGIAVCQEFVSKDLFDDALMACSEVAEDIREVHATTELTHLVLESKPLSRAAGGIIRTGR